MLEKLAEGLYGSLEQREITISSRAFCRRAAEECAAKLPRPPDTEVVLPPPLAGRHDPRVSFLGHLGCHSPLGHPRFASLCLSRETNRIKPEHAVWFNPP